MKPMVFPILFTALVGLPALAEDAGVLVLPAQPYPTPKLEVCKQVLEEGRIVKTDASGALHIPFDGFYFVIEVDEKEMRCRMYRHISGG